MKLVKFVISALLLLSMNTMAANLIPFGSSWQYLNPQTADANPGTIDANFDANWFKPGFNLDAPNAWNGPSRGPFARKDDNGISNINAFKTGHRNFIREPGTLLDTPASGQRGGAYFRHQFTTTEPLKDLALQILADDGATFYLDGVELTRFNCCNDANRDPLPLDTTPDYSSLSSGSGSETAYSLQRVFVDQELAAGTHVLAASVHNRSLSDSDLGFSVSLSDYEQYINVGSEWRYFEGEEEPSDGTLDWAGPNFRDNSWESGPGGFGYDFDDATLDDSLTMIGTELFDMQNFYSSVYLRQKFAISNLDDLSEMVLTIDYDDSFVAYVNGHEVARAPATVPGETGVPIPFDTLGVSHESTNGSGAPGDTFIFSVADIPNLDAANNVLAIHGLNTTLGSSDFILAQIELGGISGGGGDPGLAGDFDNDGDRDSADIDALSAAVRGGQNPSEFDVNGDGVVNNVDRTVWIEQIKNTYVGDSDFDGQFSSGDLVAVFVEGQFEDGVPMNSGWATGDWDGDGDFGTGDFVAAFTAAGFEKPPREGGVPAIASVPEPTSIFGLLIAATAMLLVRTKR